MTSGFRERDGVRVTYDVRGLGDGGDFPYVNDLPSLKEAVAIGRHYPGIYGDGASTHIIRTFAKLHPPGSEFHHFSMMTHRWRVLPDGSIQLIRILRRQWQTRIARDAFIEALKQMPYSAPGVYCQLSALASIASQVGLEEASRTIREILRCNRHRWSGSSVEIGA